MGLRSIRLTGKRRPSTARAVLVSMLMRRLMDAVRYDHDGTRVRLIRRHIESESETLTV